MPFKLFVVDGESTDEYVTEYHPDTLVETPGRRFASDGLIGATYHYLRLDVGRNRSNY